MIMLQHVMMGSTVTQIQKMTTVVSKKRKICMENVLSDFGKVRSNLFKTQKISNQKKKLTSKRQN